MGAKLLGAVASDTEPHIGALLRRLGRLDALLATAFERTEAAQAPSAAGPLSGAYIPAEEIARLLDDDPGAAPRGDWLLHLAAPDDGSRLAALAGRFGLGALETALLLVALAPELDRRYERIYGYLQDDMTRRRATAGFALGLLLPTPTGRLAARKLLAPEAPLLRHHLLRLLDDPQDHQPPLHARELKVEERVVAYLLGSDALDRQVGQYARLVAPARRLGELVLPCELRAALERLVRSGPEAGVVYHLTGAYGAGRATLAGALCAELGGAALLTTDAGRLPSDEESFGAALGPLLREAALQGALLAVEGADDLLAEARPWRRASLLAALARARAAFLLGEGPWEPRDLPPGLAVVPVTLGHPDHGARVALWERQLGGALPAAELAGAFRLTPGQIRDAAATARANAMARAPGADVSRDDLYAACRLHSAPHLGALASKVAVREGWGELVLPDDQRGQLREICDRVRHRALVEEDWGFGRRLALGGGISVLFSGPSGTGKTMAAGAIAGELGLDLYKVDLSLVVSKYIGETEKNLGRIFDEAARSGAVLFFDEADALFGKRAEVKDAHDRYANIEVGYLLQKLEEYPGLAVLATNMRKNLDDAFVRRLQFIVEFPFPGPAERLRIWEQIWPPALPRDPRLDLATAARRWEIAGGHIRNIALAAAHLAAADGGAVTMAHLSHAARREYQKIGKVVGRHEFAPER
ncbi:MAG TPA: ATP-binding protein [Chloroflexaceae bacterium]|nr:ATP-binding protein [Chloroflexaceae bacterium]